MSSRIEERQQDEETMDNLDFEEISDEELDPEESKTGKFGTKTDVWLTEHRNLVWIRKIN